MTGLDDLRSHRLVYRCASEIEMEPVRWIWPGRVALGKHTCIAGEPGTGKSQLTIDLAARVSMGAALPCGEGIAPQGSVIILSAEDGAADTIVPRLHAAGADLGRIVIINSVMTGENGRRGFSLQADLELLEDRIQRLGDARLVIVDPVSSYLAKIDSHKNADVRSVLEPFSEMAERSGVGIVSVTHFSKTGAGNVQKAVHRFIGSIAFIAAPRAAFAVVEDPDDSARHLFLHAKNNLAPPQPGLAFRLKQTIVKEGISASRVDWEPGHVSMSANEAMAAESSSHRKEKPRDAAQTFLRELLADGPVPNTQIRADTEAAGLSWATVRRAQEALRIVPRQEGKQWVWELPLNLRCSHAHFQEVSNWTETRHFSDQSEHLNSCPTVGRITEPGADLEDAKAIFEERAAVLEFDARLERHEAERAAGEELWPELPAFLDHRKRSA